MIPRHPSNPWRPAFRVRALRIVAAWAHLTLLASCDLPTAAPRVESRWAVPVETTRFGVSELLPPTVSSEPGDDAFVMTLPSAGASRSLDELCGGCSGLDGQSVPKPGFTAELSTSVPLGTRIRTAEVLEGSVLVEVFNGLGFDLIRPAPGVDGRLTLSLTDATDGDPLGSLTVDGTDTAFPTGTTLVRAVPLLPGTVDGGLRISVHVDSPAGDAVTLDSSATLSMTAAPTDVRVGSVAAEVGGESADFDLVRLDVQDVGPDISERVVRGALVVGVRHPFGIPAVLLLTIEDQASGTPLVQAPASISEAPESRIRVELTATEFQSFLGRSGIVLRGRATVPTEAGPATLRPGDEATIEVGFDLTLEVGG